MKKFGALVLLVIALTGCNMMQNGDDDLHLVPVTNNPHIVPNHGTTGIPMPN
jgi:hypothetical protein